MLLCLEAECNNIMSAQSLTQSPKSTSQPRCFTRAPRLHSIAGVRGRQRHIYRYPHARNSTDLLITIFSGREEYSLLFLVLASLVQSSMPYSSFSSRDVSDLHTLRSSHGSYRPNKSLQSTGDNIWQNGHSPKGRLPAPSTL